METVLLVLACALTVAAFGVLVSLAKSQGEADKQLAESGQAVVKQLDRVVGLMKEQEELWKQLLNNARQRLH